MQIEFRIYLSFLGSEEHISLLFQRVSMYNAFFQALKIQQKFINVVTTLQALLKATKTQAAMY